MDDTSIPDLSPEERAAQKKEARRLYNQAWRAAHPGYSSRKSKEWREQNPEKHAAYASDYQASHQAELVARSKKYRDAHVEERRVYQQAWEQSHAEERRAYNREWAHQHPEKKRVQGQRYRAKHRPRLLARAREYHHTHYPELKLKQAARLSRWQKANPDKVLAANHRRLARKASAPINDFTAEQWEALCAAVKYRCCYCGEKFPADKLTPDHLTPYEKQGSNTLHNVLPCCGSCNSRKGPRGVLKPVQPFLLIVEQESATG